MRANAPQLPGGGGWAQLELTGALTTRKLIKHLERHAKINFKALPITSFVYISVMTPASIL